MDNVTPVDFIGNKQQYEYLSARGLDNKDINDLNLVITKDVGAFGLPTIPGVDKAIIFPVTNIHGELTGLVGGRYFYSEPTGATFLADTAGSKPKFLSPKGADMHFYFPQNIRWDKLKRNSRVYICESYVKAAVMCKLGYYAVGISGCHGWGKKGTLHPGLMDIDWLGLHLTPVIFFDSNVHENNSALWLSVRRLIARMELAGVESRWLRLPVDETGGNWGLDDFYMARGQSALSELVEGELTHVPSDIGTHVEVLNDELAYIRKVKKVVTIDNGVLHSPAELHTAYANRIVWEEDRPVLLSKRWMQSRERTEVAVMDYRPGDPRLVEGEYFNLWDGLGVNPVEGDVSLWKQWLELAIANEQERVWFEQWLAWPLQNLGGKLATCVFLTGKSGLGKGWLATVLRKMYGLENSACIGLDAFESAFNAHWAAKQIVIVEECERISGTGSRMYTRMKDIITNGRISYHAKGVTPIDVNNSINLLLEGNDISALGKIDEFDRRIAVLGVGDHTGRLVDNTEYWNRMFAWIGEGEGGGGAEALLFHLMYGVDMEGFNPAGAAPMTEAKKVVIEVGRGAWENWVGDMESDLEGPGLYSAAELFWFMNDGQLSIDEIKGPDYKSTLMKFTKTLAAEFVERYGARIKCPYTKKPTTYYVIGAVTGAQGSADLRCAWRDKLYGGKI